MVSPVGSSAAAAASGSYGTACSRRELLGALRPGTGGPTAEVGRDFPHGVEGTRGTSTSHWQQLLALYLQVLPRTGAAPQRERKTRHYGPLVPASHRPEWVSDHGRAAAGPSRMVPPASARLFCEVKIHSDTGRLGFSQQRPLPSE